MSEITPISDNPWYSNRQWAIHVVILLLLMGANLYLTLAHVPGMVNPCGIFYTDSRGPVISALLNVCVTFNVMGFVLGCFLAILPFGKVPYYWRYGKLSYLSMILVQLGFAGYGLWLMNQ